MFLITGYADWVHTQHNRHLLFISKKDDMTVVATPYPACPFNSHLTMFVIY